VNAGGVLNAASGQLGASLAPGAYISIFGSNLAADNTPVGSIPYKTILGGARVFLGGEALPLVYASSTQINAVIPYDVPVNTVLQLIVQNGTAYAMPQSLSLAATEPGVFTQNGSGSGAGAIVVVKTDGTQFLNTPSAPATAGDALVIYSTGLGAVDTPVAAGAGAPSSPPANAVNSATVTIGGQNVQPFFAGLSPGYFGLYQVNIFVPPGISANPAVPVVVTLGGASSPPVTVAIK
jgi:uncharacterized protein (TIGR03437 family)